MWPLMTVVAWKLQFSFKFKCSVSTSTGLVAYPVLFPHGLYRNAFCDSGVKKEEHHKATTYHGLSSAHPLCGVVHSRAVQSDWVTAEAFMNSRLERCRKSRVKSWEFWQKFGEERICADMAKHSVGSPRLGFPPATPGCFAGHLSPSPRPHLTAAPEPLHPLVGLQGRLCLLDQYFRDADRKDGTCWLQTRCQSMQRGLYCKQSF